VLHKKTVNKSKCLEKCWLICLLFYVVCKWVAFWLLISFCLATGCCKPQIFFNVGFCLWNIAHIAEWGMQILSLHRVKRDCLVHQSLSTVLSALIFCANLKPNLKFSWGACCVPFCVAAQYSETVAYRYVAFECTQLIAVEYSLNLPSAYSYEVCNCIQLTDAECGLHPPSSYTCFFFSKPSKCSLWMLFASACYI
jgi:hypothetical protein